MADINVLNTSANLSGKTLLTKENDYTITGAHTFDRDPSAPFVVTSGSAVVTNLDADMLDGQHGSYYQSSTNQNAGTLPVARLASGTHTTISPTATGSQNNWAPGLSGNTLILSGNASLLTVTGFSGGVIGQRITLIAAGVGNIALVHQSASSSAGNKLFNLITSANMTLVPFNGKAEFYYNGTNWVMDAFRQGTPIDWTYSAGDYDNGAGGTWTVDAADINDATYTVLESGLLHLNVRVHSTVVGGTPEATLTIANTAYGGFTYAGTGVTATACHIMDNSVRATGRLATSSSITALHVNKEDVTAAWTAGTAQVECVFQFPIA